MADRPSPCWPRTAIATHLGVVLVMGFVLVSTHDRLAWLVAAIASGTSLFVLTGLIHEASHHLLAGRGWANEILGNLAGWPLLTPLSAYRAFHLKHHQATNRDDDPNAPLNSRWMLAIGALAYVALIHRHALKTLRGRDLARHAVETAAMILGLAALMTWLPHAVRERAVLLPLLVTVALQNLRIVSEHLDLPAGRFHDTWQLVLPRLLSRWLLHYDHHLEHHLRPGLHWHQLPNYRAELVRAEAVPSSIRVTLGQFAREVFLSRKAEPRSVSVVPRPHWAGRDAIRARPRRFDRDEPADFPPHFHTED
jgi:fatty acid desaturase